MNVSQGTFNPVRHLQKYKREPGVQKDGLIRHSQWIHFLKNIIWNEWNTHKHKNRDSTAILLLAIRAAAFDLFPPACFYADVKKKCVSDFQYNLYTRWDCFCEWALNNSAQIIRVKKCNQSNIECNIKIYWLSAGK